jgi:hypothetical protein
MKVGSLFSGIVIWYNPPMPSGAKPKQYPKYLVQRTRQLYEAGYTQVEIAKELGMTQKVVWNLMRRHSIPRRVAAKRNQHGERNHMWKGGQARYAALHLRVQSLRGKPQLCETCGADGPGRSYDWANQTGRFDDPSDYKRLCRSCHWKLDQQYLNLGAYAQRKENSHA